MLRPRTTATAAQRSSIAKKMPRLANPAAA